VKVLLAFGDVALGVQLQEALEAQRLTVRWDGKAAAAPQATDDVVILDADEHRGALAQVADAWRAVDPAPGLIAIGASAGAAEDAAAARCAFTPTTAPASELASACAAAARLRFAAAMTPGLARRALGLSRDAPDSLVMQAARAIDIEIPRAALAWHAHHYVCATDGVAELREARALIVPEIELTKPL